MKNIRNYQQLNITNDNLGVIIPHPDDELLNYGLLKLRCRD